MFYSFFTTAFPPVAAAAVTTARYCCKACQVEHWKWHKALCRAISKPAAAAAAGTTAALNQQ
jgi:hypothetical protein